MSKAFHHAKAVALADTMKAFANLLLRGFHETPGGDAYEYRGSMDDVEALREAVQTYEDHRFKDPTVDTSKEPYL